MKSIELILIVAVGENGVIGNKGEIPWHFKEDMRRFKDLTSGHPVIMGRKTFESIVCLLGKPLPNRINIVLTKNQSLNYKGILIAGTLNKAITFASQIDKLAYITGGQQVYAQTIEHPLTKRLEITEVRQSPEGDAFFPEINKKIWTEIAREDKEGYSFVSYGRIKK